MVLHWFYLGFNEKALVLQWCCLWSNEKAFVVLHVLFKVKRKHWFYNGFNQGQQTHTGFTMVLLRAQRKTCVLQWFWLGSNEKHRFYHGFA